MARIRRNIILVKRKFVLDRGGETPALRRRFPEADAKQLRRTLLITRSP